MEKKSVIIIGAGVAGLAAGVYLQSSGFDVTIYEQHTIPGGLSTSWSRKGYLFEGGMHWLTGSSPHLRLNRVWRETGALKSNNPIYDRDPLYTLIRGEKQLRLFRTVEKLREEFINYAPEDKAAINRLCRDITKFKNVHLLVSDIRGVKTKTPARPSLSELCGMIPACIPYLTMSKKSYGDYVAQFKNEDIRHLLRVVIGARYNALSFVYTLGAFASGDCGYPEGGSLRLTQNMADTFTALGGKIVYRTRVTNVVEENGKAIGVNVAYLDGRTAAHANSAAAHALDASATTSLEYDPHAHSLQATGVHGASEGSFVASDYVLVTQDTRKAIDTLFEKPLTERWANSMRRVVISEQNMFVCLGVKADLSHLPPTLVLPLETPFEAAGLLFNELCINNYAQYKNHAPEGCTAVTCLLLGDSYTWWNARKADGTYKQCKEELAVRFIACVKKYVPEIVGNVEVTDIATPLTYERYTGSFEGSWMSVWDTRGNMFTFPAKSKSIARVYFAGERSMMPGGLPIAVWSGRRAAQTICKDSGVEFVVPEW